MSYYSTVYGQRSKLDLIYTAFFTGIAFSRRRTRLHQPPSVCKSRMQYVILFAEDTRVALGWRGFKLLADQTHAEDMGVPAMGSLHLLGVIDWWWLGVHRLDAAGYPLCKRQLLLPGRNGRQPCEATLWGLGGWILGGPTRERIPWVLYGDRRGPCRMMDARRLAGMATSWVTKHLDGGCGVD